MARWWRPVAARGSRLILAAAVGFGGAWIAFMLFGRLHYQLGPFNVEYFVRPGASVTEINIPPLGRVRADSHVSPLHFTATLDSVDPDAAARALRRGGVPGLVAGVERAALEALEIHAWRWAALGAVGATVAALAVYRRRPRSALGAAAAGIVLVVAAGGTAWGTYRPSAFLEPTFSGSLRLAPTLVGPIRQATDRIEDFRAELSRITEGALQAYAGVIAARPATGDAVAILHISDVHASPIGMDFAQRVARSFRVDAVVDTGDITSFGTPLERAILSRIQGFGVPYLFVPGNHDDRGVRETIARLANTVVLDDRAHQVAGITVYGAAHPLYTPDPAATRDDDVIEATVRGAGQELAGRVAALPGAVDILAVHDGRMAQASAGLMPIAVSGHFHDFAESRREGTLFLRVGTTGGGGLDTFTAEAPLPLAAQILYFQGEPPALVSYDWIRLDPRTRDLTIDRRLADDVAAPVPGPSPTPTR